MTKHASAALIVPEDEDGIVFAPETPRPSILEEPQFETEDISYPRLKLLQGISAEVLKPESVLRPGQWHITGDAEGRKSVTFIPLGYNMSRARLVGPDKDHLEVACSSSDGKLGIGDPGGTCKICSFAQWAEDPLTHRRTLPCSPSYHYLGFVPGAGLVQLRLSRTATNKARELNGFIQTRHLGKFGVLLTAEQVKTADKIYFVPDIVIAKLGPSDLEDAHLVLQGY